MCPATSQPYINGDPASQSQHIHLSATHCLDTSDAPFTPPELHISPASPSATSAALRRALPATPPHPKPSCFDLELRHDVLYLDVHLFPLAEHQ